MDLIEYRKQTGLSQAKFAAKFHIPLNTYFHWEQGRHRPPEYVIDMIATILDNEKTDKIPVQWLEKQIKDNPNKIALQDIIKEWKQYNTKP